MMAMIYTHAGGAHADELWACAALLAVCKQTRPDIVYEISRVATAPTSIGEYDFVIDIGERFDGKQWFDHHQIESATERQCAFSLVVNSFPVLRELRENNRQFGALVERVTQQDLYGLRAFAPPPATVTTCTNSNMPELGGFLAAEYALTELFMQAPLRTIQTVLVPYVENLISSGKEVDEVVASIMPHCKIFVSPPGPNDPQDVELAFLSMVGTSFSPSRPPHRAALYKYLRQQNYERHNAGMNRREWLGTISQYSQDATRNAGCLTLYLLEEGKAMTPIPPEMAGLPGVRFVHSEKFMVVIEPDSKIGQALLKDPIDVLRNITKYI